MSEDGLFPFKTRREFLSSVGVIVGATLTGCLSSERNPEYTIPSLFWDFETDGRVTSGILLDGDTGYFSSYDGRVYAVKGIQSGDISELWRFSTYGRVFSRPTLSDGNVYFGSEDNFLYSVSAETGEENWRLDTGRVIGGGRPEVSDGVVYIPSGYVAGGMASASDESGRLQAVDAQSGELIWEIEKQVGFQSPSVIENGILYQGCRDNAIYALNSQNGEEIWRFEAEDSFCSSEPRLKNDSVYVGSEDGSMYALDADDGSLVWEFETDDIIVSSPVATDDAVYFGSHDNNLYAVDPDTGEEIWRFETGSSIFSSPAYRDGVVYVGSTDGTMYAVDGSTGQEIWEYETEKAINSSPVVTEDMVYFGSNDNGVYAVKNHEVDEETYIEYRNTLETDGIDDPTDPDEIEESVLDDVNEDERETVENETEIESPPEVDEP